MKIQIASDLHIEFLHARFQHFAGVPPLPYAAGAEVLVLAGDIHKKDRALKAFTNWPVPVIYVHGNHEMYGAHIHQETKKLREAARGTNIHFLESDELILDGVRFLGTTLWTDYAVFGDDKVEAAMDMAEKYMTDHKQIRTHYRKFMPKDAREMHLASRAWLKERLDEPFSGPTVVVTHMGPHPGSITPEYKDDLLTAAYISDLSKLMGKAQLWIHGHVHANFDYHVNGTRIVTNPRGYPKNSPKAYEDLRWENPDFKPNLIVEV